MEVALPPGLQIVGARESYEEMREMLVSGRERERSWGKMKEIFEREDVWKRREFVRRKRDREVEKVKDKWTEEGRGEERKMDEEIVRERGWVRWNERTSKERAGSLERMTDVEREREECVGNK